MFEAICNALCLPQTAEIVPLEQLAGVFSNTPFLLVLDNFEQIAEGGDMQVQALRRRVPAMTLFLTSRQRLNVAGEREFGLVPLPTPLLTGTPERMEDFACVRLFVDRCRQRDADFMLDAENVEVIAQICARLEGVPLALELAAAWTRTLTLAQLLARLEKRLDLPVSNRRDLPLRHRSLRAVLEGSYRLLPSETQLFFARLSVFSGGWTLEAAQAVCALTRWKCWRPCRTLRLLSRSRRREKRAGFAFWKLCASSRRNSWRQTSARLSWDGTPRILSNWRNGAGRN